MLALVGISFLPRLELGAYPQMPVEAITEQRYQELTAGLKLNQRELSKSPINIQPEETVVEKYCDGDNCSI